MLQNVGGVQEIGEVNGLFNVHESAAVAVVRSHFEINFKFSSFSHFALQIL